MVTKGTLVEVKVAGAGPASTVIGATLFTAVVGVTITTAVPDLVVSWVEVAVTVTLVGEETVGASVRRPDDDIWPAVVLQVTVELKLPVPMTVAMHWLSWPEVTVEREHDAVTDETVDGGFTVTVVVPDMLVF
jgi:hypothetical protein